MKRKNSKIKKIAEYIRKEIISRQMKPGSRITEAKISKIFDVSRVPVREAFRILHSEGYLKMIPNRGSFVRKVSKEYFNEISEVYFIIAPKLLNDAIPRFTDNTFKKASAVLDKIESCKDFNRVSYLIWDFGKVIYGPSRLDFMKFVMDEIYKHNIRALSDVFVKSPALKYDVTTHRKFLELCRKKKLKEAITLWNTHLRKVSKEVRKKSITD